MMPEEKEMMRLVVEQDQRQKAIIVAAFERILCMAGEECTLTYNPEDWTVTIKWPSGYEKAIRIAAYCHTAMLYDILKKGFFK
jgi:hypothetical protein|nr:MAG TPA: hypothetical protein [Caudoviricetes sp.]